MNDTSYNIAALVYAILLDSSVDVAITKIFDDKDYKLNDLDRKDMFSLYIQGLSITEVAEVFNVTYSSAYKSIKQYESKNGIKKGLSEVATSSRPKVKLC